MLGSLSDEKVQQKIKTVKRILKEPPNQEM